MADVSALDAACRALTDATTSAEEVRQIVETHPSLWAAAAGHANAYPDLLTWLAEQGDQTTKAIALSRLADSHRRGIAAKPRIAVPAGRSLDAVRFEHGSVVHPPSLEHQYPAFWQTTAPHGNHLLDAGPAAGQTSAGSVPADQPRPKRTPTLAAGSLPLVNQAAPRRSIRWLIIALIAAVLVIAAAITLPLLWLHANETAPIITISHSPSADTTTYPIELLEPTEKPI
ncbi:MAG: hypothetical protein LBV30_04685 [Propionibacteriaceae bacterium]|jgi:hypothetical protein|nr:hypothetical protein [Propionibacteriaceae bacterium]